MEQNPVARWLEHVAQGRSLGTQARAALAALQSQPRLASYGSLKQLSDKCGVSTSTFTRLAQTLEYSGWPALQLEIRARYLVTLTPKDVEKVPLTKDTDPIRSSLARDSENLELFGRSADVDLMNRAIETIAGAATVYVLGLGGFSGIAHIFHHWAQLYGYPMTLLDGVAKVPNVMGEVGEDDVLVVFGFWRMYAYAFQAIRSAHARGAQVVFVSDNRIPELAELVDFTIEVPTESIGPAPSVSAAVSVVQAMLARLATIDPARTDRQLKGSAEEWERFDLLHKYESY